MVKVNGSGAIDDALDRALEKGEKLLKQFDETRKKAEGVAIPVKAIVDELPKGIKSLKTLNKELEELGVKLDKDSVAKVWTAYKKEANEAQKELKKLVSQIPEGIKDIDKFSKQFKALAGDGKKSMSDLQDAWGLYNKSAQKAKKTTGGQAKELQALLNIAKELSKTLKSTTFKVNVQNQGFQKTLDEMSNAITRFRKRENSGRVKGKNFFDEMLGTKEANQKSSADLVKTTQDLTKKLSATISSAFEENIGKSLEETIKKSITQGLRSGLSARAIKEASASTKMSMMLTALQKLPGYNKKNGDIDLERVALTMMLGLNGTFDPAETSDKLLKNIRQTKRDQLKYGLEKAKVDASVKAEEYKNKYKYKYGEKERVRSEAQLAREEAEAERLKAGDSDMYKEYLADIERRKKAEADYIEWKKEKEIESEKEAIYKRRKTRDKFYRKVGEYEEFLSQFEGKELTARDKQILKVKELEEEYERLEDQANNNKGNWDATLRTKRKLLEETRKLVAEELKEEKGYSKIKEHTDAIHKTLSTTATLLARVSSFVGSGVSIFNTIRNQIKNLSTYIGRNISSLASRLRSSLTTAIQSGTEQYEKLEKAKIGFESFYGAQNAQSIVQRVQQEAIKAPALGAGDLADYITQLAPVSGGNSDLAINAALGILKTLQYGGASSSEMEYVVKNIRDVIAKGTAQAVDIRQFNRAMPALEQAIEKAGLSGWLNEDKDGSKTLKIDKTNAKEVLKLFADLNVGENSPVKDIFDRTTNTISGLKEAIGEQRDLMVTNIYQKSGLADRVRGILERIANGDWGTKIEDFFVKHIKKVLDFLDSVKWNELVNRLQEGWGKLKEALANIFSQFKQVFGVDNSKSFSDIVNSFLSDKATWEKFWNFIKAFIEGFGGGIKDAVATVKWIVEKIDLSQLTELARTMGYIASPMGKIWSVLGGLVRDVIAGAGRFVGIADTGLTYLSKLKLSRIEKAAGNNALALERAGLLDKSLGGGYNLASGARLFGTKDNSYAVSGSTLWHNKTVTSLPAAWKDMSLKERAGALGGGVKGWGMALQDSAKSAFSKIADFGSKAFSSATKFMIGETVTNIVSSFANTINPQLGKTTKDLGDVASAAAALGSEFGPLAGAIGGLVTVFVKLKGATDDLEKAQHSATEAAKAAALAGGRQAIINNVLDNLEKMTGADGKPLYQAYEDTSETGYKAMVDAALRMSSAEVMRDPAGAQQKLLQAYLQGKGSTAAGLILDKYAEDSENTMHQGVTDISKTSIDAIKKATLGLISMGVIDGEENLEADLKDNVDSWIGYLKNKGIEFSSVESLNNFNEHILKPMQETYDNTMKYQDMELHLYYDDGNGELQDFGALGDNDAIKRWMETNGFVLDGDTWKTTAQIQMEVTEQKTKEDIEAAEDLGMKLGMTGMYGPVGLGYGLFQLLRNAGIIPFAHGGRVTPIYRAGGGDARGVDTVPIMAQPGEFVMRKSSVDKAGIGVMSALNRGDMMAAARSLGTRFGGNSWNNSRNWTTNINNNQRSSRNQINIFNRNSSQRYGSYVSLANRIALA